MVLVAEAIRSLLALGTFKLAALVSDLLGPVSVFGFDVSAALGIVGIAVFFAILAVRIPYQLFRHFRNLQR